MSILRACVCVCSTMYCVRSSFIRILRNFRRKKPCQQNLPKITLAAASTKMKNLTKNRSCTDEFTIVQIICITYTLYCLCIYVRVCCTFVYFFPKSHSLTKPFFVALRSSFFATLCLVLVCSHSFVPYFFLSFLNVLFFVYRINTILNAQKFYTLCSVHILFCLL